MYRGYEHADVLPDVMDGDRLSLSPRFPPPDGTAAEAVVAYRLLSCLCGCSCVAHVIVVGMRDRASAPNSGAGSRVSGDSSLGAYKAHDVRRSACIIGGIDVVAASRRHFLHTLLKHESWHGHSQIADLP